MSPKVRRVAGRRWLRSDGGSDFLIAGVESRGQHARIQRATAIEQTNAAVELKVAIEQMREQVQNLE